MSGPVLDGPQLLARLDELAAIGRAPSGGVTRLAYSAEDRAGRDLMAGWARAAGLDVTVDPAGNLLGVLPGLEPGLPRLGTGSHLDTVVDAGALDGSYGAVAAVQVAAALHGAGVRLRHPLVVVGFSNEEGARGTPGMVGSNAIAGVTLDLGARDDEGVPLGDRLRSAGGDPDRWADAAWAAGSLAGFLELHIEQGPVLEHTGTPIGVVEAITGRANVELVVTGEPRHAGSTPMELRHDALVTAAHLVLAVQELAEQGHVRVATAGRVEAVPGVRNVVAGRAVVSLDLRDGDDARLAAALDRLAERAAAIAARTGCAVEVVRGPAVAAVPTDDGLSACIEAAAGTLGLGTRRMPSGAGHDSQLLSRLAPIGMCFVPSIAGISHAPGEATEPGQLVDGARVLLGALLEADRRLDPA